MTEAMGTNSVDGITKPFLTRIEERLRALESLKGAYMADCRDIRKAIKGIYSDARESNVPVDPLKQLIKYRALERKMDALFDELDDAQDKVDFDVLVEKLGILAELPLGEAAMNAAKKREEDVRPRFNQEAATPPPAPKPPRKKPGPKPKAKPGAEEAAALQEIEAKGVTSAVGAAMGDQPSSFTTSH